MELNFRKLRSDEIECKVSRVTEYGVSLLLYKDARCDQKILDETVTPMRWQRRHRRDNRNCIVSIYDPDLGQWIEKEDTGCEPEVDNVHGAIEKGVASDSFKRACFNWGIGRELYSSPNIFIFKDKLSRFAETGDGKFKCSNAFKVSKIEYAEDSITSVVIDVYDKGKVNQSLVFKNEALTQDPAPAVTAVEVNAAPEPVHSAIPVRTQQAPQQPQTASAPSGALFTEDEVILFGNCRGETYGTAKNTENFRKFLVWVKNHENRYYKTQEEVSQFTRFKKLAERLQTKTAVG